MCSLQTEGDLSLVLRSGLGLYLYFAVCKVLSQTVFLSRQQYAVDMQGTVSFVFIEGG